MDPVEFGVPIIIIIIILFLTCVGGCICYCPFSIRCLDIQFSYKRLERNGSDRSIATTEKKSNNNLRGASSQPGGIRNNSTICYMISIAQAIAASEKMMKTMEKLLNNRESKLMRRLLKLCNDINEGRTQPAENSRSLMEIVNEGNWTKMAQQDAFDMLSKLINGLYKEYSIGLSKNFAIAPKLKMLHSYSKSIFKCRVQDHLGLSLALTGNYTKSPGVPLEDLIQFNFNKIIIDNDPTFTTHQTIYGEVPQVLLLHIQANFWNKTVGRMEKADYHIKYNEYMNLELDISSKDPTGAYVVTKYKTVYKLKSLINHGGSIDGGHYMTFRENGGSWWVTNDDQVANINFRCNKTPYIMFYDLKTSKPI